MKKGASCNEIFLDNARLDEIDYAHKTFGIDGVTINLRHIMLSGKPFLMAVTDIPDWITEFLFSVHALTWYFISSKEDRD